MHDVAVFVRFIDVKKVPSCDFQKEKAISFPLLFWDEMQRICTSIAKFWLKVRKNWSQTCFFFAVEQLEERM